MSKSMILEIPVKPEKREEFLSMMKGVLPDTRKYDGCQDLALWTPEDNDSLVQVYEVWESKAHQEKYFAWRLENGMMDALADFLAGEPKVIWLDAHEYY